MDTNTHSEESFANKDEGFVDDEQAAEDSSHLYKNLTQQELEILKIWEDEQKELKKLLIIQDNFPFQNPFSKVIDPKKEPLEYVGGIDISFGVEDPTEAVASIICLRYPQLDTVFEYHTKVKMTLPYICGFLAFREVPHFLPMIENLKKNPKVTPFFPQILMCDGNGILHPRGCGFACHLGALTGLPTIGVAKNFLCVDGFTRVGVEQMANEKLQNGGDFFLLTGKSGITHGAVVRPTTKGTVPIYVSPGHNCSIETAVKLVTSCCKFRIPETTRKADLQSRDLIRKKWTGKEILILQGKRIIDC